MTHLDERTARETLVYEALRFANWAAGEGICPVEGENAKAPEDFLMEFSNATNDEDWDTLADRLSALPSSPVSELVDALIEWSKPDTGSHDAGVQLVCEQAAFTLTAFSTRNAELEREVKRLREALSGCFCPRPVNAREYGFTVGECVAAGECGCCDGETLRSLSASPQGGEHE